MVSDKISERRLESGEKYFTCRFRADIYEIKLVIGDTLAYYDRAFGILDDTTRFEMKIVLNELMINSMKHGGKPGAARYISAVAGMRSDDCAFVIIEDDGDGYDTSLINIERNKLKYADSVEDIEETGRGIFIVKNLCEEFMVNEKGNKVVIYKRLNKLTA